MSPWLFLTSSQFLEVEVKTTFASKGQEARPQERRPEESVRSVWLTQVGLRSANHWHTGCLSSVLHSGQTVLSDHSALPRLSLRIPNPVPKASSIYGLELACDWNAVCYPCFIASFPGRL